MGCGASSAQKKELAGKLSDGVPTTAPPPPEEGPKALVAGKKEGPEIGVSPEEVPTREPSEQEKQAETGAPISAAGGDTAEEFKAWSLELAEGGDAAATKLQSARRGKQARREVEKIKNAKHEPVPAAEPAQKAADEAAALLAEAEKVALVKEVAPQEEENPSAAGNEGGHSPEELQAWASGLGEGGGAAATKLQASHRGKQARAEVGKIKAAKQTEEPPEVAPAAAAPETAGVEAA